ncbi:hypothetical protein [Leifsonia xyli]|uniref:hypothetical protein n=1 Tax=Leifsonia xyli TaxID=1575 RepID=UPI000AA23DDF|nr:hypothetical protein [Leifsonia xyli]
MTTINSGDAVLFVESSTIRMRFTRDRGQLFLDLSPAVGDGRSDEWYSIDLVRRLFTGRPETSSVLDASYAEFVERRIEDIEQCFEAERWPATRTELKKIKVRRAKERFG